MKYFKLILLGIICLTITGCFPKAAKYVIKKQYLLNIPTLSTRHNTQPTRALQVSSVTIAAPFNQNYFLYRINSTQYLVDYYNSFLALPARQMDSALANYLKIIGHFYPVAPGEAAPRLQVDITELYADYRNRNYPKAVVTLHFTVTTFNDNNTAIVFDKTLHSAIPLEAKDTTSLLAAWSKGLQIDLTAGVRSLTRIKF